jgi:hypothetical protein
VSAPAAILDYVRRSNRATAANWDLFASHRARLTSLIGVLCGRGIRRLAVVGAGNCNDLDLDQLLSKATEIQLLDIDGEAIEQGLARQALADSRRIEVLAGIDITGAAATLSKWTPGTISDAGLQRYQRRLAGKPKQTKLAGCDVIVSACLLSQLILPLVERLGPEHPRLLGLVQQLRDQHLRFLGRQLRAGGRALLAIDFVSSDTCPALLHMPEASTEALVASVLQERNFFTGTNPFAVRERLWAQVIPSVTDIRLLKPWRWQMSTTRAFLVCALTFQASPSKA